LYCARRDASRPLKLFSAGRKRAFIVPQLRVECMGIIKNNRRDDGLNVEPQSDLPQPPHSPPPSAGEGEPSVELEVLPPPQAGSDVMRIAAQRWLVRNLNPLFMIFFSLALILLPALVVVSAPPSKRAPAAPAPQTGSATPQADAPDAAADAPLKISRLQIAMGLVAYGGMFVCVLGLIACALSWEARQWVFELLGGGVVRPLPALRALDVVAVVLVLMASGQVIGALTVFAPPIKPAYLHVVSGLLAELTFLAAVAAAIYLSRVRAGGLHGSAGLWPFWALSPRARWRGVGVDIGWGVLTYGLTIWMVGLASFVSNHLAREMGYRPQKHPVLEQLTSSTSLWVTLGFLLVATAGAAFFEELLFRGVLYNVLRRYFGKWPGAMLAAVFFAAMHPPGSPYLGLFVLAMILTWLYERTGRLVSSMALHATNNLITLLVALTS
jgi:membrane protease YdiL (CAAX protease family)